jgi:hypothetical protein
MAFGWLCRRIKTSFMIFDNNLWAMRSIQHRISSPIVLTTAITSLLYKGELPDHHNRTPKPSRNTKPKTYIPNKTKIKIPPSKSAY